MYAGFSQKQENKLPTSKQVLKELSEGSCKCIDSIDSYNKTKEAVNKEIHSCIDTKVLPYMLSKGLSQASEDLEKGKTKGKKVNLTLNSNPESDDYKRAYYEIESYLMTNCSRARVLATAAESKQDKISNDPIAHDFYNKAIQASKKKTGMRRLRIINLRWKKIQNSPMPGTIWGSATEESGIMTRRWMPTDIHWLLTQKVRCLYKI
jgi:hypothetical protein